MERSQPIDILRLVALILVCFGRHAPVYQGDRTLLRWLLHHLTSMLSLGGWTGVDLFFVLSGFLVSGLLFTEHVRTGRISASRFLIRRGLKIYPAFWVLILVTVVFRSDVTLSRTWHELLFVQNYRLGLWAHTWSLAVEEHFYLLLLIVFSALVKWSGRPNPFQRVPLIFLMLASLSLVGRIFAPPGAFYHLFPSHLRMDALFCGVLISYYYHYYPQLLLSLARRWKWLLIASGALALMPAFIYQLEVTPFIYTWGLTVFYLGCGALLMASLTFRQSKHPVVIFLAYLGSHSYSIYLWHLALAGWFLPRLMLMAGVRWTWYTWTIIYVSSTLLFGVVMSKLVEFPVLRIRDRWFPSAGRVPKESTAALASPHATAPSYSS